MAETVGTSRRLSVFLFTDIVDSVALQERLGTAAYADLIDRHNANFELAVNETPGARLMSNTGDGFLAQFRTASDAVEAALRFQHDLHRELNGKRLLQVRIGIDQGETLEVGDGSAVIGKAANRAARVMTLAAGGQILMTRAVFDDARQFVKKHVPTGAVADHESPDLQWPAHGAYLFKGLKEPVDIFEVGAEGMAPLTAPVGSDKAHRAVSPNEEPTLGWRPGVGLEIPGRRDWIIEKKLGQGYFGEVWLAEQKTSGEERVFKFCFDADLLISFRREIELWAIIRDSLGRRDDFAAIYEVQLERPPFYLESEYLREGTLHQWAERIGGIDTLTLEERIEFMVRIARAADAAHSVQIIHKDIKPANILVFRAADGTPRPRLADFGIGKQVASAEELHGGTHREHDPTLTIPLPTSTEHMGARIYAPPEYFTGKPASVEGDIYSIGVILYQMVAGSFEMPLGTGWERHIEDPLLRADIRRCVDIDPDQRFHSVSALIQQLESLDARRRAERSREDAERAKTRMRKLRRGFGVLFAIGVAVTAIVGFFAIRAKQANTRLERVLYALKMRAAESALESGRAADATTLLAQQGEAFKATWPWRQLLIRTPRMGRFKQGGSGESHGYLSEGRWAYNPGKGQRALVSDHEVIITDTAGNGRIETLQSPNGEFQSATFSPDGRLLVASTRAGATIIWDTESFAVLYPPASADGKKAGSSGQEPPARHTYVSADGTRLVKLYFPAQAIKGGYRQGAPGAAIFKVKRVTDGLALEKLCEVPYDNPMFYPACGFHPGEDLLAVPVSLGGDGKDQALTIEVWDVRAGVALHRLPADYQADSFNHVAFSTDGSHLLFSGRGAGVYLCEARTGRNPRQLGPGRKLVFGARLHPRFPAVPQVLCLFEDSPLSLWDADEDRPLWTVSGHDQGARHAAFSPDGSHILTGALGGEYKVWETRSGTTVFTARPGNKLSVQVPRFNPDGSSVTFSNSGGTVEEWSIPAVASHHLARGFSLRTPEDHSSMYGHDFSAAEDLIAVGFVQGRVGVWDLRTMAPLASLEGHDADIGACSFTPDGRFLFTGSRDGKNILWRTRDWQPTSTETETNYSATRVFFSPAADRLVKVYTSWPGQNRVGDPPGAEIFETIPEDDGVSLGRSIRKIEGTEEQVELNAALSPDGRMLVTGYHSDARTPSEGSLVKVWNVQTGEEMFSLPGHTDPIKGFDFAEFRFSPDSSKLVAAANFESDDGVTAKSIAWSLDSAPPRSSELLESRLTNVKFGPDDRHALAATADGRVVIWNTNSGETRATLELPPAERGSRGILKAEFHPVEPSLVATLSDTRVCQLWEWTPKRWFEVLRVPVDNVNNYNIAFSPDGSCLWVPGWRNHMELWKVPGPRERELLKMLWAEADLDQRQCVTADGRWKAIVEDDRPNIAVTSTQGRRRTPLIGPLRAPIEDLRFVSGSAHDDVFLVIRTSEGEAGVWDPETGQQVLMIASEKCELVRFSSDHSETMTFSRVGGDPASAGFSDSAAQAVALTPGFVVRIFSTADPSGTDMTLEDRLAAILGPR